MIDILQYFAVVKKKPLTHAWLFSKFQGVKTFFNKANCTDRSIYRMS